MLQRILLFLLAQVFWVMALQGQKFRPHDTKLYQSLVDDVYILTLFVETSDYFWEEEEMNYYYREYEKSQEWLKAEAQKYERAIQFKNDYFFDNRAIINLEEPYRRNPSQLLRAAMEELGHKDLEEFLSRNGFDLKKNKLKLLFFLKSEERSHAFNYWSNSDVDMAVIYCRTTYGMVANYFTIAHELLHQFGAWDLYFGLSQSSEKAEKAKELYPHSIMIRTWGPPEKTEVDELTAWLVGWNYDYKEEYAEFKPVRKERRRIQPEDETKLKFNLKKKKKKKTEETQIID